MVVRILQIFICVTTLMSLQGCFVWHSTTVRDIPPSKTTTVYHESTGETVAVTTTP